MTKMLNTQICHTQKTEEILEALEVNSQGLTSEEAEKRLEHFGLNRLPEAAKRGPIMRFLMQFNSILIYVLLGAAAITAFLDHWIDSAVILAVVIVNAVIGFIQEGKAEEAMDAIRNMLAPHANVMRDGQRQSIEGDRLVPGDVVLLEAGDKVPADLRLLQANTMQVQEAILTGESVPVEKDIAPVRQDAALGDRACMAFSGTIVTSGQARGVVTGTGAETEIGKISGMLSKVETLVTPLVKQTNRFAEYLTIFILTVSGLILLSGWYFQTMPFTELFMAVVGLSVAAIPEGLPAVLTITLAVGVQAMAERNAIIRRLPAIETLGSVSVICTDKTGTLTRNEMMVASVLTAGGVMQVDGEGYAPQGTISSDGDVAQLHDLALAAALCNDAAIREEDGQWRIEGDPMEAALLSFAGKTGLDWEQEQHQRERRDILPFDSTTRYMATLNTGSGDHQACIFVKGAPERILGMCTEQRDANGENVPIDPDYWQEQAEHIASQGQRLLAFALKPVGADHRGLQLSDIEQGLILLGMTGMIDPPRPEAVAAIADCYHAGIAVKMITGDHAGTAAAIGKQIGLKNADRVLTGADLDAMDDIALTDAILETDIFARTSPEHKLRLVMALQSHGLSVAMTGDGVNDAPALKRADAGIAMGQKGSEATKEAADLVLADDNFASIAAAVREGRTVYDNIKKVIAWTLPTNGGEAMTVLLALMLGLMLPITPVQILWINLVTAVTLGIALAFEPTEERTMLRPPRAKDEPLLSGELLWGILVVSLVFLAGVFGIYKYAILQGYSIGVARTMAMNTLVVMEIFHLFFVRNLYGTSITWDAMKGTKVIWLAITIVTLGQFAVTYLPFLQKIFQTEDVPFDYGVLIVAIGVASFILIEIEKQVRLRFFRQKEMDKNAAITG
ncbi:cation-transporting P-type ATPase [Alterisphingorhabdus coralli]|uniref:Cation-transporting P-type ATPase n=1 Tax=Alterisphingorhabdus coralli TaxID=3071408 RepID=A0AA97F4R9_9SPHN|nr:cation-transporting P-type ATPase [Parasphingorhabdus sp. SCSIO 66989]WOE74289.1 cation-transporting P-type ATPase [Parasphingorhabdus sp. SCSIO 66989]